MARRSGSVPAWLPALDEPALAFRMGEAEEWAITRGFTRIAGVDEAGRGPLAGPVVAACVLLDPDQPPPPGLADSKQLTAEQRNLLRPLITEQALAWGLAEASPERIDQINILQATLEAMAIALEQVIEQLVDPPQLVVVDGTIPFPCRLPLKCLVKGDQRSLNVAAASILAKIHRDEIMIGLDLRYPGYGFARHKGYPTAEHRAALRRLGPCAVHRRTFRGVLD